MREWWRRRTLRFRLAIWYALGGALLLSGFSATLYLYVANVIARPLDHELRRDVEAVRERLTTEPDGGLRWDGEPWAGERPAAADQPWFEVWSAAGQLIGRTWSLDARTLDRLPAAPVAGRETLSIYSVRDDTRLRVLTTPLRPGEAAGPMLRVMRIHEPAGEALGALRWIIVIALPVVITLLVAGGWLITRHWLWPLHAMVAEAEQITADDLGRRLTVANPHDELGRLGGVFNRTLSRLEDSFQALDRFVADASHELRTPLTTLRSVGEVGLRRGRTAEEYREIIGSMLEEAQRLRLLIDRLLELANVEGGARTVHREEVRLDEFVAACAAEVGILAEAKNQRIELAVVPCRTRTDPVLVRQALQNLIENAIKYSPLGGTIRVGVEARAGWLEVTVADQGPGIAPAHAARIADRFFRVDDSRVRGRGGFGLGLAITKAYMHALGGTLDYAPAPGGGSVFRLRLPAEG
ncbi:MAG: HAMP domain-containing protein [Opitutaceae bacterium]|nr:HAMP domain-containing protein [Opitutaceae bacterium]